MRKQMLKSAAVFLVALITVFFSLSGGIYASSVNCGNRGLQTSAVVRIGGSGYDSLEEALESAEDGAVISVCRGVGTLKISKTVTIRKKVVIDGRAAGRKVSLMPSDDFAGESLIIGEDGADITLNYVNVCGDMKCRVFDMKSGKLTLNRSSVRGGRASDYAGGVYLTGESELILNSGTIAGNYSAYSGSSDPEKGYLKYADDLWVGSKASATIRGESLVGTAFVNSDASAREDRGLKLEKGRINTVFVEWEGELAATFTKTGGSVGEAIFAQDSTWPHAADFLVIRDLKNGTYSPDTVSVSIDSGKGRGSRGVLDFVMKFIRGFLF